MLTFIKLTLIFPILIIIGIGIYLWDSQRNYPITLKILSLKPFRHRLPNFLIKNLNFRKLVITQSGLFVGMLDGDNNYMKCVKRDHLNREVLTALTTDYKLINVYPYIFHCSPQEQRSDITKPFNQIPYNRIRLYIDPRDAVRPAPKEPTLWYNGSDLINYNGANKKFDGLVEISPADIIVYTHSNKYETWQSFFESNEKSFSFSSNMFYF